MHLLAPLRTPQRNAPPQEWLQLLIAQPKLAKKVSPKAQTRPLDTAKECAPSTRALAQPELVLSTAAAVAAAVVVVRLLKKRTTTR